MLSIHRQCSKLARHVPFPVKGASVQYRQGFACRAAVMRSEPAVHGILARARVRDHNCLADRRLARADVFLHALAFLHALSFLHALAFLYALAFCDALHDSIETRSRLVAVLLRTVFNIDPGGPRAYGPPFGAGHTSREEVILSCRDVGDRHGLEARHLGKYSEACAHGRL